MNKKLTSFLAMFLILVMTLPLTPVQIFANVTTNGEPDAPAPPLSAREANMTFEYPTQQATLQAISELGSETKVDLVFIIDDSGSMSGYINNVKRNITDFCKGIQSSDIELRIGIVMFRDDNVNASRVLTVNGSVWHKTYEEVIASLNQSVISGGIEPTLDALGFLTASDSGAFDWDPRAIKHGVLITDEWMETPWNRHGYSSLNEVIEDAVKLGISISVVTVPSLMDEAAPLVERTGGSIANINDSDFKGFFLDFSNNLTSVTNPAYSLKVLGQNGDPLKNADVIINEESRTTDDNGTLTLNDGDLSGICHIQAEGYNDYIFDGKYVASKQKTIQLDSAKGAGKPYVSSVYLRNSSTSSGWADGAVDQTLVSEGSSDKFDVSIFAVWGDDSQGQVYFQQDIESKLSCASGTKTNIELKNINGDSVSVTRVDFKEVALGLVFEEGKDVYAYCASNNGGPLSYIGIPNNTSPNYQVKLNVTDWVPPVFDENLKFSPMDTLAIPLGDAIPFMEGESLSLSLGAYQVSVEREGARYKVAIGGAYEQGAGSLSEQLSPQNVKDDWNDYKNFVKAIENTKAQSFEEFLGELSSNKNLKDKVQELHDNNKRKFLDTFEIGMSLVAFIEYEYVNNRPVLIEVGGFYELDGKLQKYFPLVNPYVNPLSLNVELSSTIQATVKGAREAPQREFPFLLNIELDVTLPKITLGLVLGQSGLISIGAYGSGALEANLKLLENYYKLAIKADASIKAEVLCWERDWKFWEKDWTIKEGNFVSRSGLSPPGSEQSFDDFNIYDTEGYRLSGRDYEAQWIGSNGDVSRAATFSDGERNPLQESGYQRDIVNSKFDTLQENIYPNSSATIVKLSDGRKMLVWVTDDGARTSANRTMLVYSIYNNETDSWSAPQAIANDGTADFYPSVVTDGQKVYVAWTDIQTTLGDDAAIEDATPYSEIYASIFDGSVWSAPSRVTSNATLDVLPQITVDGSSVKVVWVNNSENDIFGLVGVNSIMASTLSGTTWLEPQTLKTNLTSIHNISAVQNDGKLYVAYVYDMDGDYSDTNDMEIFHLIVNDDDITENRLTTNDIMDSSPQYGMIDDEMRLFWYGENNLHILKNLDESEHETLFDAPNGVNDGFTIAQANANISYIVWPQTEGEHVVFYSSIYDGEHWNEPVSIGDKETKCLNPSAVVDDNGEIWVVFNEIEQNEFDDGTGFSYLADGNVNLCLLNVTQSADLAVSGELLYVDYRTIVPKDYIPLDLLVKNNGFATVDNVDIYINDELYSAIAMKLKPGRQDALTVAYTLPDEITYETLNIKVLPTGMQDSNVEDNTVSVSYGLAELKIAEAKVEDIGAQKLLSITLENESFVNANGFILKIHEDTIDGAVIAQFPVASLDANGFVQFSHAINKSDINYDGTGLKKYVVEIDTAQEEYLTENNIYVIAFARDSDESLRAEVLRFSIEDNRANVYGVIYNNELEAQSFDVKIELLNIAGEVIGAATQHASLAAKSHETIDETIVTANDQTIGSARILLHPTKEISELPSIALNLDTLEDVVIDTNMNGISQIYKFDVPDSEGGLYQFKSEGSDSDTFAILYDENGRLLVEDDNGGDGENFSLTYNLSENRVYYYKIVTFNRFIYDGVHLKVQAPGNTAIQLSKLENSGSFTVTYDYETNGGDSATKTTDTVQQGANIDLTPTAEKPGWIFFGWNTSPSATSTLTALKMGDSDLTLYAIFKNSADVTFVDYNGETKTTRNIVLSANSSDGSVMTIPPQNILTGWTPIGWTTDTHALSDIEIISGEISSVSAGDTYYGLYQMPVTLTYNSGGGSGSPPNETKYRRINSYSVTEINNPVFILGGAPTRSNYIFMGWATRSNADAPEYQPGDELTLDSNVTLYTLWQIRASHTVSYNANGGTGQPSNQTKYQGQTLTLSSSAPSRIGYTFIGWSTDPSATTSAYLPGSSYNDDTETTLYAVWKPAENILLDETYNSVIDFGGQHIYYKFVPSETGNYSFISSGHSVAVRAYLYAGGEQLSDEYSVSAFALTYRLLAGETYYYRSNFSSGSNLGSFEVRLTNAYTISYDANGGASAPASQIKTKDMPLILATSQPSRSGYTFLGWSDSPTDKSAYYTRGDTFEANGDAILYAVWSDGATYTISYHRNGGSGGPNYSSIKAQGETLRLSSVQPTRANYIFLGWSTISNSATADYQPGDAFTLDANTTLYAVWQQLPNYAVSYDANEGNSPPATQTKYQGIDLTLTTNQPTRVGYVFRGWSTDNQAVTPMYLPGSTYTADTPLTLYAIWESAADLSLNSINVINIDFAGAYNLYRFIPSVTGDYAFTTSGQLTTASASLQNSQGSQIRSNSSSSAFSINYTLNAGETYYFRSNFSSGSQTGSFQTVLKASSKIIYNANGVGVTNVPAEQTKIYGETLQLQTNIPVRFGYNFLGWSENPEATSASYLAGADYTADESIILYAVWGTPQALIMNTTLAINITNKGERRFVRFTPNVSATYRFSSSGGASANKQAYLFDSAGNQLAADTSYSAGSGNFSINYRLTAGETYYYRAQYASSSTIGFFNIVISSSYTVSYDANGSNVTNVPAMQNKQYETALTLSSAVPARFGYTFLGWSDRAESAVPKYIPGDSYFVDSQATLYAVWEETPELTPNAAVGANIGFAGQLRYYKFTPDVTARYRFYSLENGATNPYGELYNSNGIRLGYNNDFISGNHNFGIVYNLTAGQTYYLAAKMNGSSDKGDFKVQVSKTYTVEFNANNGSNAPASQYKDDEIPLMLPITEPTRFGYTFIGWNSDDSAAEAAIQSGAYYTDNADIVYYAVWQEAPIIDIDTGVIVDMAYNKQSYFAFTPSETASYRFFTTGANEGTYVYIYNASGGSYLTRSYSSSGDSSATYNLTSGTTYYLMTVLYDTTKTSKYSVKVIRNSYAIIFNANGGVGGPTTQEKITGTDLVLSNSKPTRSGYNFLGWSTDSSGTTPQYVSGERYKIDESLTLYAVWTEEAAYSISYNANGGSNAPPTQTKAHGIDLILTLAEPTRANFRFLGWDTNRTATEESYRPGSSFTADSDTTLYAVWAEASSYTVSFDANGGGLTPEVQTKYEGVPLTLTEVKPVFPGRNFIGWAESPTASTPTYYPGDILSEDRNITLYALWGPAPSTISLNAFYDVNISDEGIAAYYRFTPNAVGLYSLTSSNNTQDPAAELYSEDGTRILFDDDNGVGNNFKLEAVLMPGVEYIFKVYLYDDDVTGAFRIRLAAIDTSNYFMISFDAGTDVSVPSPQVKQRENDLVLSDVIPNRSGYLFEGWAEAPEAATAEYQPGDVYSNDASVVLYAVWTEILIESEHPYANNEDRTWLYVHPDENADYLDITFSKETYVQDNYDRIYIYDADGNAIAGSPFTGSALASATVRVEGASFSIRLTSNSSTAYYGFAVIGIEGGLYTSTIIESSHPYANNEDTTWTYSHPEPVVGLYITFSPETYVDSPHDKIYIYNEDGVDIPGSPFTGNELADQRVYVEGGSFDIRLVSNGDTTGYGFAITDIAPSESNISEPLTTTTSQNISDSSGLRFTVASSDPEKPLDSGEIILALYDKSSGKLLYLKSAPCDGSLSYTIDAPSYSNVMAKVFVWSSMVRMEPLGSPEIFNIP